MKFGKQILAQQVPGWSSYYLDYKGLKKIVSSLTSGRPSAAAAALALGARPTDLLHPVLEGDLSQGALSPTVRDSGLQDSQALTLLSVSGGDEERGPQFQAHKAAFFFKLERELEKINSFYLQKEAELKLRLETLLSKRMAAAARLPPSNTADSTPKDHVEWKAVEEGFRLLERDLSKLQQFVDINAIGFRKILKKWDKRSKSTTKELYLSRQVDVQPVFNHQLITELSDTVTQCLLDLTDVTVGLNSEGSTVNDMILTHQLALDRSTRPGPYRDLETNFRNAMKMGDEHNIRELIRQSDSLQTQPEAKAHITRILWKVIIDAPAPLADLVISSLSVPFDFQFIDDINGRTCLHEVAAVGEERLVNLCIQKNVQTDRADIYGRTALHYAAMNGHAKVCQTLLSVGLGASFLDRDNYTPLMYAILRGNIDCVRVLLDEGKADLGPPATASDLTPLSLACHVGHVDIVRLLLQHNAKSIPNSNGEYPIHIAARDGHAEICRLLKDYEGWDTPDKYNEWTPLFHAARHGNEECVQILLELGSRVNQIDETGKQAIFYAAWYGHPSCVSLLLQAALESSSHALQSGVSPVVSPEVELENSTESDLEIPSLSLPPPIMPYRVYGHNFLDKACLIHISVGHTFSQMSKNKTSVKLSSRIMGASNAQYPNSSPSFKLVMTCQPDIAAAPYSVSIPVRDERDCFTFQVPDPENMSLEFSICPSFGTKTIGRAVALSSMLLSNKEATTFILPIMDQHLHVIGEVLFEARMIRPFEGVTLEIGGAVETYWKSLATPYTTSFQNPPSRMAQPFRTLGSAQTSPSNHTGAGYGGHTITLSSLVGQYIHLTVQVTRDLHPVVYNRWRIPTSDFDLGVSDVTLSQLQALSSRAGLDKDILEYNATLPSDWYNLLSEGLFLLQDLIKVLPSHIGVHLDIAYASCSIRERHMLNHGHTLDLNCFVDAVLKAVYQTLPLQPRRRIVFGSFNPDVCAALNWKQPNYPVFLASKCGIHNARTLTPTSLGPEDLDDRRLSSISAAVDWAKTNNLLGVFLDADLLTKVPSLMPGVRDMGLLLGVYGSSEQLSSLSKPSSLDNILIDALYQDGVVSFLDHSSRGFY